MRRRDALWLLGASAVSCATRRGSLRPVSKEFKECLADVYEGEVIGEAVFGEMIAKASGPGETYVLGTLLQLETEGKATLRPVLARLGLTLAEDRAPGVAAGKHLVEAPLQERFAHVRDAIREKFLPVYQQLGQLVSDEEDPDAARVAAFMGRHERALLATCERIAQGAADPVAPVAALLHFPLRPLS